MVDHSNMKLGKLPPVHDPRIPLLSKYTAGMHVAIPHRFRAPLPSKMWTDGQQAWGMMLNDNLGDCTIAGCGHYLQLNSLNANKEVTVSDQVILKRYEDACGYNPSDPNTDQGGVETDVLKYWMDNPLDGHELKGFAAVNPQSDSDVYTCIMLFGSCYLGVALPITAQQQDVWDVVPGWQNNPDAQPGSWGGHCVVHAGYGTRHETVITWGQTKLMTPAFRKAYCDEAYALVLQDWIAASGESPSGFNLAALLQDMNQLDALRFAEEDATSSGPSGKPKKKGK